MPAKKPDLLQGTLDLLVLKTLVHGALHGYGIAQKILVMSRQVLEVQHGSLYPALHRLERKRMVKSEWRPSEAGRMAKFYSLTKLGKSHLEIELKQWEQYSSAINWVLET